MKGVTDQANRNALSHDSRPARSAWNVEPNIRKIAVLRANALGDLIFALPALDALRAAYPEADITWLGRDWHAEFFSGRPGPVGRVIVVPPCSGVRDEPYGE